jgi:hypothetical protein
MSQSRLLKSKRTIVQIQLDNSETIDVAFFPVRVAKTFTMREMAKKMTSAIAFLTRDSGVTENKFVRIRDDKGYEQTTTDPIGVDILESRSKAKEKALHDLVDVILDKDNVKVIVELIYDSLREERDLPKDAEEFMKEVGEDVFLQMIFGLIKANMVVFGPLVEPLSARFKELIKKGLGAENQEVENENSEDKQNKLSLLKTNSGIASSAS